MRLAIDASEAGSAVRAGERSRSGPKIESCAGKVVEAPLIQIRLILLAQLFPEHSNVYFHSSYSWQGRSQVICRHDSKGWLGSLSSPSWTLERGIHLAYFRMHKLPSRPLARFCPAQIKWGFYRNPPRM